MYIPLFGKRNYYNQITELEITVSHFPTIFRDLAEQIQFARTNLLHSLNGKSIIVYKNVPTLINGRPFLNPYFKLCNQFRNLGIKPADLSDFGNLENYMLISYIVSERCT